MIRREDYTNYYENLKELGNSSFATIYEGNDINSINSKESIAIKVYEKEKVNTFLKNNLGRNPSETEKRNYFDAFKNEANNMNILQGINKENKNAVILDNCFETDKHFAIVMEKCDDNLFNHLADRNGNNEPFNSEEIHEILRQLNNSFKIMVNNKILHRAIKLQNILLKYLNKEKTKFIVKLKLTDDSCSLNNSSDFLDSNFGRNFRIYSPEVLKENKFTEESDLWSLGILIYTLYFGVFPFDGDSKSEVLSNITEDAINNLQNCENKDLNDLIRELLIIEPNKRINWEKYFIHPFFKKRMDFKNFYDCDQSHFLGYCNYGNIYKGTVKDGQEEKAIKILGKSLIQSKLNDSIKGKIRRITDKDLKPIIEGFYNEVNHMKILQGLYNENQNTVIFDEYFNTESEFVIIMELCDGNLLDYFIEEKKNKLNLDEIHEIISQLNNSFKIMVENKILHRAIKPQNILLKFLNKEKTKYIVKLKLTDDSGKLNLSNNSINKGKIKDDNLRIYAPEVLEKGRYTEKSDLFSLGVLMYYLSFNKYPFGEKEKEKILNNIKEGINEKTDNPEFDDLLKKLLKENENERISWKEYFEHKFFKINQDFNKYYEYEIKDKEKEEKEILGRSGHGIIYKVKDKTTGEMKAIKKVDKITIINHWKNHANKIIQPTDDDLKQYYKGFFNEINNMKILQGINNQNQNTVIFYEYFNTKESFAYVMELCDGNLIDYIKDKNLEIEDIKKILIQLNNSFKIIHENKIFHRAIKPENVLYKKDENSEIIFKLKLTDNCCLKEDSSKIGMPIIILNNNLCISAPEVLNGEKFKEESDLWSLGVLIYYLKFKNYPFNGKNKDDILIKIKEGLKQKLTDNDVFNDLVQNLLIVDSTKRMSWRTYFEHKFLK